MFAPVWPTDQVPVQPTEERDSGIIGRKEVEEWEKIGNVKVVPIKRRNSDSVLAKGNRFAQYWFDKWMENDRERINQLIDEITTDMAKIKIAKMESNSNKSRSRRGKKTKRVLYPGNKNIVPIKSSPNPSFISYHHHPPHIALPCSVHALP